MVPERFSSLIELVRGGITERDHEQLTMKLLVTPG